jgi:hypothetical protein
VRGGWEATDQELRKELEEAAFTAARLIGDDATCSSLRRDGENALRRTMRRCRVSGVRCRGEAGGLPLQCDCCKLAYPWL